MKKKIAAFFAILLVVVFVTAACKNSGNTPGNSETDPGEDYASKTFDIPLLTDPSDPSGNDVSEPVSSPDVTNSSNVQPTTATHEVPNTAGVDPITKYPYYAFNSARGFNVNFPVFFEAGVDSNITDGRFVSDSTHPAELIMARAKLSKSDYYASFALASTPKGRYNSRVDGNSSNPMTEAEWHNFIFDASNDAMKLTIVRNERFKGYSCTKIYFEGIDRQTGHNVYGVQINFNAGFGDSRRWVIVQLTCADKEQFDALNRIIIESIVIKN
jgi:hypothetical protein